MVFRIFVTQPSRLQHLECFEAQLYGLDPLVFYPCGEYQRIRLEVILALSYAVMQRIALVVVGFHAVQHTDDYRPVRELQTEELAFQLPETCLVFPCPFHLLHAFFLLLENTHLVLVLVVFGFQIGRANIVGVVQVFAAPVEHTEIICPYSHVFYPILLA